MCYPSETARILDTDPRRFPDPSACNEPPEPTEAERFTSEYHADEWLGQVEWIESRIKAGITEGIIPDDGTLYDPARSLADRARKLYAQLKDLAEAHEKAYWQAISARLIR
jgi:hypothetical protein